MIALLLPALLQVTPVAPIVKGTGLPPPAAEEAAVMAPVNAVLAALETADRAAILANTLPEGTVTAARVQPDGTRRRKTVRWAEFVAGLLPAGDKAVEKLGTPAIEIDEDVAMVWAPYTFTVNGRLTHCGYDLFDLVRDGGSWKVLNITYSHRTTGCPAA